MDDCEAFSDFEYDAVEDSIEDDDPVSSGDDGDNVGDDDNDDNDNTDDDDDGMEDNDQDYEDDSLEDEDASVDDSLIVEDPMTMIPPITVTPAPDSSSPHRTKTREHSHSFDDGIHQLDSIRFGLMSSKHIRNISVCQLDSSKLTGARSVYDERMGTVTRGTNCITCGLGHKECPGHFGHIELRIHMIHPMLHRYLIKILKCFCIQCSSILMLREHTEIVTKRMSSQGTLQMLEKQTMCQHCHATQPRYTYSTTDCNIIVTTGKRGATNYSRNPVDCNELYRLVDAITDDDVRLIGIDPEMCHPRDMIIKTLLVIPTCARPFAVSGGSMCDDDLTLQYLEIIRTNNRLETDKSDKLVRSLIFKIKTLMDNSAGKSRHSNNRPYKGIKERLSGKSGIIRMHLLGKRVDYSARTVVGPDSTLPVGWIAIPPEIADTLTASHSVTAANLPVLQAALEDGTAKFLVRGDSGNRINLGFARRIAVTPVETGDIIRRHDSNKAVEIRINASNYRTESLRAGDILIRDGEPTEWIPAAERPINIRVGDSVEVGLKDGAWVLLNRQPTLHTGSFMAHRVVIRPGKTIRMPLAITPSYAGDFDGDELNIHSPTTIAAQVELANVMNVENQFMTAQSGSANIKLVQDALLGLYLLTKKNVHLPKAEWIQHLYRTRHFDSTVSNFRRLHELMGENVYTTHALVSVILPRDLNYYKEGSNDVPGITIRGGIIMSGVLCGRDLKGGHGSLVHLVGKEYGNDRGVQFVNQCAWLADSFLSLKGFTIDLHDCSIDSEVTREIEREIDVGRVQANSQMGISPRIHEARVCEVLNKAKDVGLKISRNIIQNDSNNHFVDTIVSGAKGAYFNICQITSLLGQQMFASGRVPLQLDGGRRSLIHYSRVPAEQSLKDKYESQGFIAGSFGQGLNPKEFIMHGAVSRETLSNTSLKTATSGYLQRKIVKFSEDLTVQNDRTVRDMSNRIVAPMYGNDDLDGKYVVKKGDRVTFVDTDRLIDRFQYD